MDVRNLPFAKKLFFISRRNPGELCHESESCEFKADISILALGSSKFFDLQVNENCHKLGQGRRKIYARSPFLKRDEPKLTDPHILCPTKDHQVGILGHIFQYRRPYLLFLTCATISDILNLCCEVGYAVSISFPPFDSKRVFF
jgi:hypothetical protein